MSRAAPRTLALITPNGQLGAAIHREFSKHPHWLLRPLTHDQIEITDRESIAGALADVPDVVVNTAYWADENPEPALHVNALGARLLAEHCGAHGIVLVHFSTDYVFSGDSDRPYLEDDPTGPRSVYGISKLAGEQLIRAASANHLIVRVASLFGVGGSRAKRGTNFVTNVLGQAQRGDTVRVVVDQFHSPTYAPDAAATLATLLDSRIQGTVHLTNAGHCSWYEFAERVFALAGLTPDLRGIRMDELPPGPARPRYSVLAHNALHAAGIASPRHWSDALADYLRELGYTVAGPPSAGGVPARGPGSG